jgi:hypothetical protein
MKVALIVATLFVSSIASARQDKTAMHDLLINHLIRLDTYDFEGERMIAGKFEKTDKKIPSKNYLDKLRSKLEGHTGLHRF